MGKYLTSLLVLVSSLLLPNEIFADEQVRRVQEELRKRHLFYADANGEKGLALTLAVKRYQAKKGFPATGEIDSVTLASLGLPIAAPLAATTPVAIGNRGQVHGANGETLPGNPPFLWPNHERARKFDPAILDRDYIDLAVADFGRHGTHRQRTFGKRVQQTSPAKQRSAPFQLAFDLPIERIRPVSANPVWDTLVLQPSFGVTGELAGIDEERMRQGVGPDRRPQRRPRSARPRKETNPFILTYRSVDRAIRSLVGDSQTKKKRSTAKRL